MNPKSLLEELPIDTKNLLDPVKPMWMVGMKDSHHWMKKQKKLLRVQESCQFSLKMKQDEILMFLQEN